MLNLETSGTSTLWTSPHYQAKVSSAILPNNSLICLSENLQLWWEMDSLPEGSPLKTTLDLANTKQWPWGVAQISQHSTNAASSATRTRSTCIPFDNFIGNAMCMVQSTSSSGMPLLCSNFATFMPGDQTQTSKTYSLPKEERILTKILGFRSWTAKLLQRQICFPSYPHLEAILVVRGKNIQELFTFCQTWKAW